MPDELFYGERTTNSGTSGLATFIDGGTVTAAAGPVLLQFFCPKVTFTGSGPIDLQFRFYSAALPLDLPCSELTYANLFTAECHIAVYAEHQETIPSDGDYDFQVKLGINAGQAICATPYVPAWFRVLADPFGDSFTGLAAISHKFGLTTSSSL